MEDDEHHLGALTPKAVGAALEVECFFDEPLLP
jgi:hypothetical protein